MTTVQPKERPILFSGAMVQAILAGRKTITRRIVKREFMHQPDGPRNGKWYIRRADAIWDSFETIDELAAKHCPYGKIGDRLWVRETFGLPFGTAHGAKVIYKADGGVQPDCMWQWRPSIFMPRWASRITLEITDVRVERLQDISDSDAVNEGIRASTMPPIPGTWYHAVNGHMCQTARMAFSVLWDSINPNDNLPIGQGKDWESNPWVWVVSFKVVR